MGAPGSGQRGSPRRGEERLFVVEHPPVITFGRRGALDGRLLASADQLAQLGVEVVQTDRGGDVTFHGPGQIVAYPIVRLNDHGLSVGAYVHGLEQVVVGTLADVGIPAETDRCAIGIWARGGDAVPGKVCAIGVRVRRGVSMHGLALNVTTDLSFFDLIVPCGLAGRPVTSIERLIGVRPDVEQVRARLRHRLTAWLGHVHTPPA